MIFVTGDTHIPIDVSKLNRRHWPEQQMLSKNDYLIICGDFGGVWYGDSRDKYWLDWLNMKNWTTIFVDGNHENFTLLNSYPKTEWKGGKVHKINESVYHLIRGQIFNIDNITIFTMGGASSHDKEFRKEGKSWWPDELPCDREYETAIKNLSDHNWKVDFIISHCAPTSIALKINSSYGHDKLTDFLNMVKRSTEYRHWYFGHYHRHIELDDLHTAIYHDIIQIA